MNNRLESSHTWWEFITNGSAGKWRRSWWGVAKLASQSWCTSRSLLHINSHKLIFELFSEFTTCIYKWLFSHHIYKLIINFSSTTSRVRPITGCYLSTGKTEQFESSRSTVTSASTSTNSSTSLGTSTSIGRFKHLIRRLNKQIWKIQ